MIVLIFGLIVFLGAHSVSVFAEPWRNRMVNTIGDRAWKGLYSLVALVGLAAIIYGYGVARMSPIVIYTPPFWLRHIALLLMAAFFPLFLSTYFPGRIKSVLRHPTLIATKTWALAHLLANGTLADVLLFGGFLAWAVVDRVSLKRRTPRSVPEIPVGKWNDFIVIVGGLGLYLLFVFWAHRWLFGVSPTSF